MLIIKLHMMNMCLMGKRVSGDRILYLVSLYLNRCCNAFHKISAPAVKTLRLMELTRACRRWENFCWNYNLYQGSRAKSASTLVATPDGSGYTPVLLSARPDKEQPHE